MGEGHGRHPIDGATYIDRATVDNAIPLSFHYSRFPSTPKQEQYPVSETTPSRDDVPQDDAIDTMSKREFLTLAAGLGGAAVGLGALFAGEEAHADGEGDGGAGGDRYLFVVSRGGDDPNRAILALLLASVVAGKKWGKVEVWFTLGGAELAHAKKAPVIHSPIFRSFGTAAELMEKIRNAGGTFGVCPPCASYAGATGDARPSWIPDAGGDWLMKAIKGAHVTWL